MSHRRRTALLVAASLSAVAARAGADLVADQTPFNTYRGLWIDRFDYNSAASIRTAFQRAAELGITDVMFQVRGNANAYYYKNNNLEIYGGGTSASYDPLQIAINEGHARGIKVHAWINTMPLWNGTGAPPANHLSVTHPDFIVKDANNQPQPLNSSYTIVNPARQDVQDHINAVARTIATNYAIDGLHLDYIRLYNIAPANGPPQYPQDSYTVSLFQQQYPGQTPATHAANYKAWLAGRITDLVGSLRRTVKEARPDAQLTASVWRDADIGLADYQQDWARWVDHGAANAPSNLLDAAMPMIYRKGFAGTDSGDLYRLNVAEALNRRGNAGVMVGLGTYMQDDPATAYTNTINQLTYARDQGANGVQLFDYGTLYTTNRPANQPNLPEAQAEVRRALGDFFAANSGRPAVNTLADFNSSAGHFRWPLTQSGSNQNVAATSTVVLTDSETHSGAQSQRLVINKTAGAPSFLLRHLSGVNTAGDPASNVPLASIGAIGFWLKTTTPDLQVAPAVDDAGTERGYLQNVIADGQWHRYEWFLNDVTHWDSWASGNGQVANVFTLDSIQFTGTEASSVVFLDDVHYDPAAVAPDQFTANANVNWHHASHWVGGVPHGAGASANLLRRSTAARTITLDKPTTLGTLTIDNSFSYTLAGPGTLTLDAASGEAAIRVVNRGAHVISAPLSLNDNATLYVDTGASLTVSQSLANAANKSLSKTGAGTLTLQSSQRLGALAVSGGRINLAAGGGKLLHMNALSVSDGATLNLSDNDLLIQSTAATPEHTLADITARIASARNGGAAGMWSGTGVTTSAAASPLTTLAVVLNDDGTGQRIVSEFGGQPVDANAVLVKYTYAGDLNLDGRVSITDMFMMDRGRALGLTGYQHGDLDYSGGRADADDYTLLDRAFLGQGSALASLGAASAAVVPEPAALPLLLAGSLLLKRRRGLTTGPLRRDCSAL